jgi:microcin C transport system ATP-binding protein
MIQAMTTVVEKREAKIGSAGPLLRVEDLRTYFDLRHGTVKAVDGVSFTLGSHETLAIVGESGCGKTITALSLMRLVPNPPGRIAEGKVELAGRDLLALDEEQMRAVRGKDIAMIFQEPMTSLNPVLTIGNQIAEAVSLHERVNRQQAWDKAVEMLRLTRISEPEQRAHEYPHQLSGGMRQRAMIAMALACKPKLLIADEPTTALDVAIRIQVLELLEQLRAELDMALLLITHDLNIVRRFADRVAVMEKGVLVEQGRTAEVIERPQHPYTRKLVSSHPERHVGPPAQGRLVEARGVQVDFPTRLPGIRGWFKSGKFTAVQGVDFDLAPGETLGVIGESGSGKTTLALAVLGLVAFQGEVLIDKRTWERAERRSMRKDIQVVFQDPLSSLSPRLTIEEIVGEGLEIHEPTLDVPARRARVIEALLEVGLTESGSAEALLGRFPHEFSGGQRQRIAIARALIVKPKVVVLDEPTSALDVTIQKQVLELLSSLQKKYELSYILVTHDIDVVRAMAHRVLVMKDSRIVESGRLEEILDAPKSPYTRTLIEAGAA